VTITIADGVNYMSSGTCTIKYLNIVIFNLV
jgi:hypothetical protein